MDSLNHDNQADVIEAFNSTSRYLDDLLNIDNPYFEGMVNQIYPSELQLNKANISDTEAPFLDLHLSVANGFVSSKIYDKRDDFDFDIVNFPFLDGDVPRRASYGVYISQFIRFARVCNHVTDFNARNKCLTVKLLQQGYRYHKLRKTFSKFYRRHYELIFKYNVGLKTLLSEGHSERSQDVSPPRRFPPSRFPPSRFASNFHPSRFAPNTLDVSPPMPFPP